MLSETFLSRIAAYSSIMNGCCTKTIWVFHDAMRKMVDTLLTLTFQLTSET